MSTKTVDPGSPPANVVRQQQLKDLLVSGEDIVTDTDNDAVNVVEDSLVDINKHVITTKRVTLHHELYTLTLPALDVSVAEHQVAVRLPANGFKFEPRALNSEFIISYLGKDYKVAYLGGIFDFPGDESWVIAFIRDKRIENEQKRKD